MTAALQNEAAGKKLLIVEDNGTNRLILNHKLSKMGFEVACAENGVEALGLLRQGKPDLILMDVSMPVMDGLEATQQIRKFDCEASSVPIVGFSAHNHAEIRQRCLDVGMDEFLCKPVQDKAMLATINRVIGSREL